MNNEDMTKKTYGKIAEKWVDLHPKHRFWASEIKILKELKAEGSVLDVGCGYGRDFVTLQSRGYKYLGIDYSPEMIRIAKQRFPDAKFSIADMYDLSGLGEFEVIWAAASLLHIPRNKIEIVLDQFLSVMKEDSVAVITLKEGTSEEMELFEGNAENQRLIVCWQEEEFEKLVTNSGFRVTRKSRNSGNFDWIVFFLEKSLKD